MCAMCASSAGHKGKDCPEKDKKKTTKANVAKERVTEEPAKIEQPQQQQFVVPAMHPMHPHHGYPMSQNGMPAAMVAQREPQQGQPAAQKQSAGPVLDHSQVRHPMQYPMQMNPMQMHPMQHSTSFGHPNMAMAAMQPRWRPDVVASPGSKPAEPAVQPARQHGEEQRRHWNAKTA